MSVKEGAWWLECKDAERDNDDLKVTALCVSLTGKQPTLTDSEATLVKVEPPKSGPPKIEPKRSQPSWTTRQPIPAADALAAKQKEIHKLMPPPRAKATVEESNKYAEAVLAVALWTQRTSVATRFAALQEAFEHAYPVGDPEIAGRAASRTARAGLRRRAGGSQKWRL